MKSLSDIAQAAQSVKNLSTMLVNEIESGGDLACCKGLARKINNDADLLDGVFTELYELRSTVTAAEAA